MKLFTKSLIILSLAGFVCSSPVWADKKDEKAKAKVTQLEKYNNKQASAKKQKNAEKKFTKKLTKLGKEYSGALDPRTARIVTLNRNLIVNDEIEAYLYGLTDKLMAGWQGYKPPVQLFLVTGDGYYAEADPYGALILSIGLLMSVESEDELTFVLAHELSHILLNHNEKKGIFGGQKEIANAVGMGFYLHDAFSDAKMEGGELKIQTDENSKASIGVYSFNAVTDNLTSTAWSRGAEDDADILGLDLMIAAGYRRNQAEVSINKLTEYARTRSEEMQVLQGLATAMLQRQSQKAGVQNADLSSLMDQAGAGLVEGVFKGLDGGAEDHLNAEERIASLKTYLSQSYDRERSKKLPETEGLFRITKTGESGLFLQRIAAASLSLARLNEAAGQGVQNTTDWIPSGDRIEVPAIHMAAYQLYNSIGQNENAIQQISKATEHDLATPDMYVTRADYLSRAGTPDNALSVLEKARATLGAEEGLLPSFVTAYLAAGDTQQAEEAAVKCKKAGGNALYASCAQRLGYDIIAQRRAENPFGILSDLGDALNPAK